MSFDAVTWAKAQECKTPRAKAVLVCLAAYADADGCAWAAVSTLLIETSLGHERTVKRGLADLRALGLLEDTGEKKVLFGKLIPIYRFPMERGPANTRQRMEQERAKSGMTQVSPQETSGDMEVMARGDTADDLGVTQVSPKLEQNFEDNSKGAGAREVCFADLKQIEDAYPKKGLGFTDREAALVALHAVLDEGVGLDALVGAALGYRNDPILKKRDFGPVGLHRWLASGRYRGWMPEAQASKTEPAAAGAASPVEHAAPAADLAIWRNVEAQACDALTERTFGSWIKPASLRTVAGGLYVVAATGMARDWIAGNCWRRIEGWWAQADAAKRPLKLVSRIEFEALAKRQAEGVG